jgi:hypothetical protein
MARNIKVYVVTFDGCDDRVIDGVFTTRAKATKYITRTIKEEYQDDAESFRYNFDITEMTLDKGA